MNKRNSITHGLKVRIGGSEVNRWNGITHGLRVGIGGSEVSIKLAADGMASRTA